MQQDTVSELLCYRWSIQQYSRSAHPPRAAHGVRSIYRFKQHPPDLKQGEEQAATFSNSALQWEEAWKTSTSLGRAGRTTRTRACPCAAFTELGKPEGKRGRITNWLVHCYPTTPARSKLNSFQSARKSRVEGSISTTKPRVWAMTGEIKGSRTTSSL